MTHEFIYRYIFEEFTPQPRYFHFQNFYVPRRLQERDIAIVVDVLGAFVYPTRLKNEKITRKEQSRLRKKPYSLVHYAARLEKKAFTLNGEIFILLEDI